MISMTDCSVSCGVKIVGGETHYQTAEAFVKDFFVKKAGCASGYTQFMFTHCTNPQSTGRGAKKQEDGRCIGDKIEEYVKANNLGVITRSEPGTNPHHPEYPPNADPPGFKGYQHKIVIWVWTIPNDVSYPPKDLPAKEA